LTAAFQSRPNEGTPGGTLRLWIGRAPLCPTLIPPPPMKVRPVWSKLSALKSSIATWFAPEPM
jgi:hypothetical protein